MPGHAPIQTSFAGGELSPRLRGRVDAELYQRGLSRCENFEPMPQGSLRMRCGSIFVRDLVADGFLTDVRLFQFRMADEQDFLLVLGDLMARLYTLTGTAADVVFLGETELLTNGDLSAGAAGWTTVVGDGSITFSAGKATFVMAEGIAPSYPYMWQSFVLGAETDIALAFEVDNFSDTDTQVIVRVGTSGPLGAEIWSYTGKPADRVTATLPNVAAGTIYVSVQISRTGGLVSRSMDLLDISMAAQATSEATTIVTPWTVDQLDGVQVVVETGTDRMVLVHPRVSPRFLQRSEAGGWTFGEVTFSAQPAEWTPGAYPGVCELFQGRLWLSGVPGQANRLWASRVGSIFDFALESTVSGTQVVLPSDGIDLEMATKGAMRWLQSGRSLLLGTDLGEHSFTSSSGALSPTDIQARDESAFGSCAIQAVHAGTMALYASADRRKVRALSYDLQTSGWNSKDITFVAEHITVGLAAELHHARDPNGSVVVLLDTGELVVCTFDPAEGLAAWWRLSCGTVTSVAVSEGPQGSFLWLAVERNGTLLLELLPMAEALETYLDSSVIYALTPGQVLLMGLDHLEGQTVRVVLDGQVLPDQVVTGGELTLPQSGASVTVGLGYTATAITLPTEGGNPAGTAQGAKRRRTKVVLRLNDSAIPRVNGGRAPERAPADPMDTGTDLTTGDVAVWTTGWSEEGRVTIEQDLPLRTEVLALFGNVQVNEV